LDQVYEVDNELSRMRHNHKWLRSQTCNEPMLERFIYKSPLKSNTRLGILEQVEKQFCNDHLGKRDEFHVLKSEGHKSICSK